MFLKYEFVVFRWIALVVAAALTLGYLSGMLEQHRVALNPGGPVILKPQINTAPGDTALVALLARQTGFSYADLVHALANAPTRTAISGQTKIVVVGTPLPIPVSRTFTKAQTADLYRIGYNSAYNADQRVMSETKVNTTITVSQVPVEPSRWSAATIINNGSGIGYSVVRVGHVDLGALALLQGGKVHPAVGLGYRLNGATIGVGVVPGVGQTRYGVLLGYSL